MNSDTLNRLEKESQQPDDIAPVMGCGELRELLAERARLVSMVGALLGGVKMHAPRETYACLADIWKTCRCADWVAVKAAVEKAVGK